MVYLSRPKVGARMNISRYICSCAYLNINMNHDTFFLITKQPVKNGMGFTIAEVKRDGVETMLCSAMLDSYITMKVATEIADKTNKFESEQAGILINSIEKINGDGMAKIKLTISLIESLLPAQTAEVRKLFLVVDNNEEFLEEFMQSNTNNKKKYALPWEDEPSSKTRPFFAGIVYYKKIMDQINSNPMVSFKEKQHIKEELDKSLRYAAQLSATEKFVAWASLQNKKRQEAANPAGNTEDQTDGASQEEGQAKESREAT